ncbi:hypothetical protein HNP81_001814 [Peribacillus huizhouensis]|uniref:Uncharacterized protein n=1 Tax=Peribacillus huizhouensis TaxID=1501239 RepID=A0ABR6CNM2_9BACI|nr:hypothetical protein [Peribacillus huizhouensis]
MGLDIIHFTQTKFLVQSVMSSSFGHLLCLVSRMRYMVFVSERELRAGTGKLYESEKRIASGNGPFTCQKRELRAGTGPLRARKEICEPEQALYALESKFTHQTKMNRLYGAPFCQSTLF